MCPTFLVCVLALVFQASHSGVESSAELHVHDGDRFVAVDAPAALSPPVPIPMLCRSERVPRFGRATAHDPIRLRLEELPGLTVRVHRHPVTDQVLRDEAGLWQVGEPILPQRVTDPTGSNRLPWLARQDGVPCATRSLVVTPPAGKPGAGELVLVLIGASRDAQAPPTLVSWKESATGEGGPGRSGRARLRGGTRSALVLPVITGAFELELEQGNGSGPGLDQLFFATASQLDEQTCRTLDVTRTALETHLVAPPAPGDGQTWTLLVQAGRGPGSIRTGRPARASARVPGLVDVAAASGVDFCHFEGPDEQLDIRPTMGPGAAWGDFDGDGLNDLYLVQGGGRAGSEPARNRLYRNQADGHFADVTDTSGTGDRGAGMGAIFFDAEGDGDLDIYVANYGADVFFHNDGQGRFADRSEAVGVGGDLWSAGVAAGDHDLDGDLDLYITSYLRFDTEEMPSPAELGHYQREDPVAMLPFAFPGERNTFLRNETIRPGAGGAPVPGELAFRDVTEELGLDDPAGRGMQPLFWDFDRDGDPDLYVANDVSFNVLFRNEGDGSFRDVSFATGMDDPRGGMGLAAADVDADGDEDVFLTNWELEANALYLNNLIAASSRRHHVATFRDATVKAGFGPYAVGHTSWGAVFFDAELDGDLDLFVANGYTSPDYESTGICVGQPNHLFTNDGSGRFTAAFEACGPDLLRELASRCAVGCDYDGDGDVDLVVTANNGPTQLLRNDFERSGHWLTVRLRDKGPNPFAIGAEVEVRAGERSWRRSLRTGTSYLGGNAPELNFGLGQVESVDSIEVRWPDGGTTSHPVANLDRIVVLERTN